MKRSNLERANEIDKRLSEIESLEYQINVFGEIKILSINGYHIHTLSKDGKYSNIVEATINKLREMLTKEKHILNLEIETL